MRIFPYLIISLIMAFLGATNAPAQVLPFQSPESARTATAVPETKSDPLGRVTPRGTVVGYLEAVAHENFEKAVKYLDLTGAVADRSTERGVNLVKKMQRLLDQGSRVLPTSQISDEPGGNLDDGFPDDMERVGTLHLGDEEIPLLVERKLQEGDQRLWVFSARTLEQLPDEIPRASSIFNVNNFLPGSLVDTKWNGVPAGHWLAIIALIAIAYLVSSIVISALVAITRWAMESLRNENSKKLIEAFALPAKLYMSVWIFVIWAESIGISVILRQYFSRTTVIVTGIAILILLWRLIDVFGAFGEHRAIKRGNISALSVVMFFRRTAKFIAVSIGIITLLDTLGFDITTGLAALGIGGLAVALGAQKTIENLVGSLTVIFDQPVRVGDTCKVGDTFGIVEQIGMRSTRIRTLNRTIVTIPNGEFSAQKIENFSHRDRFWFHPMLGLRYETSPEQIRLILLKLREALHDHPNVDSETARVRFVSFGASSLNIEVFAYISAIDFAQFLAIQEELNLQISTIVSESGSGFAFPSQTLYMAKDSGLPDKEPDAKKS